MDGKRDRGKANLITQEKKKKESRGPDSSWGGHFMQLESASVHKNRNAET